MMLRIVQTVGECRMTDGGILSRFLKSLIQIS